MANCDQIWKLVWVLVLLNGLFHVLYRNGKIVFLFLMLYCAVGTGQYLCQGNYVHKMYPPIWHCAVGTGQYLCQGNYVHKMYPPIWHSRVRRFSEQVTCLPRGPRVLQTPTSQRQTYEHSKVQISTQKYSSVSALQQTSAHKSTVLSALCNRNQHTKVQFCQRFATEISTQNCTLTFPLLSYLGSSDCPSVCLFCRSHIIIWGA
jgi:hypothetical protein